MYLLLLRYLQAGFSSDSAAFLRMSQQVSGRIFSLPKLV